MHVRAALRNGLTPAEIRRFCFSARSTVVCPLRTPPSPSRTAIIIEEAGYGVSPR